MSTVPATMTVGELAGRIASGDAGLRRQGMPILDRDGCLVGIITRGDVLRAVDGGGDRDRPVVMVGSHDLVVAYPDEILSDAVARMLRNGVGRLPVVSRQDPRRLLGYLGRAEVMAARRRQLEEEDLRERTWLGWAAQRP